MLSVFRMRFGLDGAELPALVSTSKDRTVLEKLGGVVQGSDAGDGKILVDIVDF